LKRIGSHEKQAIANDTSNYLEFDGIVSAMAEASLSEASTGPSSPVSPSPNPANANVIEGRHASVTNDDAW